MASVPPEVDQEPILKMIILLNPLSGAVQVQGPIENKMVAYAMLELARDAIAEKHAKAAKSGIVGVSTADMLEARLKGG